MFWKNEAIENNYGGWTDVEKVQVYECQFSYKREHQKTALDYTTNGRCLVVANTVEEAIAACRARFPKEFVLHSVHKRNQRCDLIVCESVLPLAEMPAPASGPKQGGYYLLIGPITDDDGDGFTAEDRKEWLEDSGWRNVSILRSKP